MLRKLAILALLIVGGAAGVWAQGTRKDDIVINSRGFPQGGASVAICAQPAVTTTTPCSPLANLFSNPGLTQALVNPLTTDGLGNYSFYAAPGKYTIQIYGAGITTKVIPDVVLPNDPSTPSFTTVTTTSGITAFSLTLSGNLSVSGSAAAATLTLSNQGTAPGTPSAGNVILYTKSADKKLYMKDESGTETQVGAGNLQFASKQAGASADLQIQAAINALPATGGTVIVDLQGAQTIASDVFSAVTKNAHLIWASGQPTFSVSVTFPTNIVNEWWGPGAVWTAPNGVNLLAKAGVIAGDYQIFATSGTGTIRIGGAILGMVNVRWYGAVGDSSTDDGPAFQAASDAIAPANGSTYQVGGTVYVPPSPGNCGGSGCAYHINSAVTIHSFASGENVTWLLAGPLIIDATVTGVSGFSVVGTSGAAMRLSGFGQFQSAPCTEIFGTANPLFIFKSFTYLEKICPNTNTQGQVNLRFDNAVGIVARDVYSITGANNTTGAAWQFQSGFKFDMKNVGAQTAGQPNSTATISTIARTSGNTVTVTATANFSPVIKAGDFVGITGVTDSTNFPNSNVVVVSVPAANQIVYLQAGSNVSSSAGTVTYRRLADGMLFSVGAGGVNPPGEVYIDHGFFSAGGMTYDSTSGSTSGGQLTVLNTLKDSDGNGNARPLFACVGANCNLLNNVLMKQITDSDEGNGGLPLVVHAGSGVTRNWTMLNISTDNGNFSPIFGGNVSSFVGINTDTGLNPTGPTGAGTAGITDAAFFGGSVVTDNVGGFSANVGDINAKGYFHTPNSRAIYVEMNPPTGLTATLAAFVGGLTVGQPYTYVVTAVDDKGNETAPQNVTAIQGTTLTNGFLGSVTITPTTGNTQVNLSWTGSTGASSYNIYRNAGAAPFPLATNVPKYNTTATTFSDTNGATSNSFPPNFNKARISGMDSAGGRFPTLSTANLNNIRMVDGVKYPFTGAGLALALSDCLADTNCNTVDARGAVGPITISSQLNIGSSTKPIKLIVDTDHTNFQVSVTGGVPAIQIFNGSFIQGVGNGRCAPFPAGFSLTSTANVSALIANGQTDGTQEFFGFSGICVQGNSAATVSSALVDLQGVFVNSFIRDSQVDNFPSIGLRIRGAAAGVGAGPLQVHNVWINGENLSGARPLVIQSNGSNNPQGISFSAGAIEHQGVAQRLVEIDGLGAALINSVSFRDVGFENHNSSTDTTSLGITIRDATNILIDTPLITGLAGADFIRISQSAAGRTKNLRFHNILNGVFANTINDQINSLTYTQGEMSTFVWDSPTVPAFSLIPLRIEHGCSGTATPSATIILNSWQTGGFGCTDTSARGLSVQTSPGIIRNLFCIAGTGGVNASSGVVSVRKNQVATIITCTLGTGTSCNDQTHIIPVIAGDNINFQVTTQAAETLANISCAVEKQP